MINHQQGVLLIPPDFQCNAEYSLYTIIPDFYSPLVRSAPKHVYLLLYFIHPISPNSDHIPCSGIK